MLESGIPEDLKEMIEEIIAYRDLEKMEEETEELLYIELPYFYDHEEEEEKEWKIEIEL